MIVIRLRMINMPKDKLVGVKMSIDMYDFLDVLSIEEDLTVPGVMRKIIKKVMDVWEN